MNKKNAIIALVCLGIIASLFLLSSGDSPQQTKLATNISSPEVTSAEKIEVIHFHATQQCWSCITIGEYALKTIKERFPEEYKNGIITFKDINGELPENREIVMKYQAGGSSLYINAISGGVDNIKEDTDVWRLVSNEKQFLDYFESKLKGLLGKK